MKCKYPKWAVNKVLLKQEGAKKSNSKKQNPTAAQVDKKCHIVVPCSQGVCESYKTTCSKYGVQVHFKGGKTLENLLVFPKDKDTITMQGSFIYWIKCGETECDDEYIGESPRTF